MRFPNPLLTLLLLPSLCFGSGMLIPKDESVPPLAIKHQRVDIEIKDGVATARIEQVFKNSVNRPLEAVYVFPVPEGAAVGEFAMYINGKREQGELVEKEKASKIYQDIVRRMRDPGLLEYLGGNLFRVSVFPVPANGEQKMELSYSQSLDYEGGLYHYRYPLRTAEKASRTLQDFTVRARISSKVPIKTVYSPSHEVGISRKGEHEAVIGFEEDRSLLDKDFDLYYGVSKKDFGLNLLTHAVEGEDGFFMMMISPRVVPKPGALIKRDMIFAFDTSGSMSGKKIDQARKSLTYCIEHMAPSDRLNVLRFSTDVEALAPAMLEVNDANREKALAFVSDLEARGGTAIDEALEVALGIEREGERPCTIVFLTDGRPTIGESDMDAILKRVKKGIDPRTRIFVFGVGNDVNTQLLDRLAGNHGGHPQYVGPDEDIEVKLSAFYDKISLPVLSDPRIEVNKVKTSRLQPRELPDLFAGEQITVLGRYTASGDSAITLSGMINGETQNFVYEAQFAKEETENPFIARLWATRQVGYLLEQIRLKGENDELKDEVILLSKEYGIVTPYTSYLVLEKDEDYATHGLERTRGGSGNAKAGRPASFFSDGAVHHQAVRESGAMDFDAEALDDLSTRAEVARAVALEPDPTKRPAFGGGWQRQDAPETALQEASGEEAVAVSKAIQSYKRAEFRADRDLAVRKIGSRSFVHHRGVWIDRAFDVTMATEKVPYAGERYFALLETDPELKKVFALGLRLIVVVDGKALLVE